MEKEKELLLALAMMYNQYCSDAWPTKSMFAGENAMAILHEYGLIGDKDHIKGNYEELIEEYFKRTYPQG